jgi:ribosomal protein S18 acetylase RimI-like enzyme
MNIRPARKADLRLLADMNLRLIQDEGHGNSMGVAELYERMSNWLSSNYRSVLFEVNDGVVGYALWRLDRDCLYLRQFYISTESRRRGYGKAAIESLKVSEWSGHQLRLEVLIGNQTALEFWRSVGFEEYSLTMVCTNA